MMKQHGKQFKEDAIEKLVSNKKELSEKSPQKES